MKSIFLAFLGLSALPAAAQTLVLEESKLAAPPPAPPLFEVAGRAPELRAAAGLYSIGDPTPEEQLHLELINRARANPNAEAARLASITDPQILSDYAAAGVDLGLMQTQFGTLTAAQPLAMNAKLTAAARLHSQDMLENVFQEHTGSDGSTPFDRLTDAGYFGSAGENIYSNAKSVAHGHAAFEVDWGGPASNGGMQLPSGHREAIHNPIFREAGIGVSLGSNSSPGKTPLDHVGPQLVTEDFGVQQNSTPLITGVAYYDLNGNNFYDLGEGIGGVNVSVSGVSTAAVTARSGGYAVPVPGNGTYEVTFSGAGFASLARSVTVTGSKNQKLDFLPAYVPPAVTGPIVPGVGRANPYSISPVPGANAYQWRSFQKTAAASEGAENDGARVEIDQSGPYDVIEGIIVKSGSFAFHLITPEGSPRSQYITLKPAYLINSGAALTFQSRLGYALADQHARVQISTDDGLSWQTIDNQDGDIDNPQTDWTLRTVSLASYAGKAARIRFGLEFFGGNFVSANDLNVGWLIDDIQFSNTQEITGEQVNDAAGTTISFTPEVTGDFSLQARARTGHQFLEWGPAISVHSAPSSNPAELRLSAIVSSGGLEITAELVSGAVPAKLVLESRAGATGPWQTETAGVQNLSGAKFRVSVPLSSAPGSKWFRLRAE